MLTIFLDILTSFPHPHHTGARYRMGCECLRCGYLCSIEEAPSIPPPKCPRCEADILPAGQIPDRAMLKELRVERARWIQEDAKK